MWYNYSNISVPESSGKVPALKVDILTTYFPGEPYQMTITTLEAINQITYPHTTYLCDEANDPYLRNFCEENGIIHVTRDNRIDAKAGNINNALKKYATGDICVVLDPDHIPEPNFLDPILPHFEDPEIGFVQIVQSYYNIKETLVARGAAEQTFQFYGPMMMTLNSYGAVNAIGANCVFRRTALDSIGGHAPGLCEDMHTAMLLYAKNWKAVYLPEVLAKGLAPSNLTNFFKQQLKWSRGTFDLLVKVYPKIFSKLTGRQKIHFGILPLHYLGGVISLINFLIPALSLFFATTPWKGNIIDFAFVLIPVAASSVLIRTFIQKWVIEKKERGFHIIGGLLHINTWWIYIVGLAYTLINKNVPYLPTPKENEWNTNYKIIIPNAIIGIISITAIIYGLQKDLTPFSIVMAGFAFFNALIMAFGIYLANKVTNQNRILRSNLAFSKISSLWSFKHAFYKGANSTFMVTRAIALPLLLVLLIFSMNFKNMNDLARWENVSVPQHTPLSGKYLGIFHPYQETGLSDIQEITFIENQQDVNFNIVSLYLAWNRQSIESFPHDLMTDIFEKDAIPIITWEPWTAELATQDSEPELREGRKSFKHIANGTYDNYIRDFIQILKSYDQPIFLRYAHEFDNPQYPWSAVGGNTPEEFIAAWKHVHELIKAEGANKIIMVWNPWKAHNMAGYYPGDDYVDWIGITLLNYDALNSDGQYHPFKDLYKPFSDEFFWFTRKPVMLAEFGSLKIKDRQEEWLLDAMTSINREFDEIAAIVMFNSAYDKNIPENDWYDQRYLDWTTGSMKEISTRFNPNPPRNGNILKQLTLENPATNPISQFDIKGVHYKKGKDWKNNYYVLTREELQNDLETIKASGLNTIQFKGSDIYDYNIRSISEDVGLQLIYEFDIDASRNYLGNNKKIQKLAKQIINKTERFKDDKNLIAYSFKFNLEQQYVKPLLFAQRTAYLNWLNSLITEIKKIDPIRSIVIEVPLNNETMDLIQQMHNSFPVDSYGLIMVENNMEQLYEVMRYSAKAGIDVFVSDIEPKVLLQNAASFKNDNFILSNWQNERYSNWLNYDGLVDFNGNRKQELRAVKTLLTGLSPEEKMAEVRILKPAVPLTPNSSLEYSAAIRAGGQWLTAAKHVQDFSFDWSLVKNDLYGNPLALKNLGSGNTIKVTIPRDYENYELIVTAKRKGLNYSTSNRSLLHTKLEE
ncbi:glycosyltransferase family 2 protein [Antarcticibacterium arcticum]|nr:glycosyltransferase family 2 protein [Antarcticibacterium arcticum]